MSAEAIYLGFGLTVLCAVGCQILAGRFRLPAIVLLLPVGFFAGQHVAGMNPQNTLGDGFAPLVTLAVAIILFDGGLDLNFGALEGQSKRVVRRLLVLGIPITAGAAWMMSLHLLGLSSQAAIMLGAILVVSGPTVVAPLLETAKPGRRLSLILTWESTVIDPIGAIIGALVFQGLIKHVSLSRSAATLAFSRSLGVGLVGGLVGTLVLWLLLSRRKMHGVIATEAIVGVVVSVAALCNAYRGDTGLIAAITMGVALANVPGIDLPEDRRFFKTIVQLVVGLLFISISATVPLESVMSVLWPTLGLIAGLVLVVRPIVTALATFGTSLTWQERVFIGWMDPRGIVAASTATTFSAPLVAAGIVGAEKLLPVTFLVIVGTVLVYGLTAPLAIRLLHLGDDDEVDRLAVLPLES